MRGLPCLPGNPPSLGFCYGRSLSEFTAKTRDPRMSWQRPAGLAPDHGQHGRGRGARWRISSSISTGAGPSASSTAVRMRSASASGPQPAMSRHHRDQARETGCQDRREDFQNVLGALHQGGAAPDQIVGAACPGSRARRAPRTPAPWSSAHCAVISEPDFSAASTTTTPRERPEMMRLRRGK